MFITACASSPKQVFLETSKAPPSKQPAQLPAALGNTTATQTTPNNAPLIKIVAMQKPTLSEISREWALHPYELRKQANALEQFIRYGHYPRSHCSKGNAKLSKDKKICEQVSLIVSSYSKTSQPKANKKKTSLGFAKSGRTFKIGTQNLAWAQSKHFDDIIDSISPMSTQQILDLTPRMIKHQGCPRNLSAAAIRKLENFLPSDEAKVAIERLYAHASLCLKPTDSAYALTHFRQALLRVLWGDSTRARTAATLAPLGAKGEELPRALFWAGMLQTDVGARDQYWSRLISDHPLSFHAINAHKQLVSDPLADAASRPVVNPSRNGNSKALTLSLRWFETLMLSGNETAASRLAFWMSTKFKDDLSLGNIIYITHLKADQSTHQASFGFVWNQIESNPANMNTQTLKLMFPLPYWEIFKRNSGTNDPLLLMSVARQESAFNPLARSPANARGLLQLLPSTAHAMAGKSVNLYTPEINAKLGSKFLSKMVAKFQSVEMALAAYNAGPIRIPTWRKRYPTKSSLLAIDLIPYRETRNYVANILRNNYWYNRLYDDMPSRDSSTRLRTQSVLVKSLIKGTKDIKVVPERVVASIDITPAAR